MLHASTDTVEHPFLSLTSAALPPQTLVRDSRASPIPCCWIPSTPPPPPPDEPLPPQMAACSTKTRPVRRVLRRAAAALAWKGSTSTTWAPSGDRAGSSRVGKKTAHAWVPMRTTTSADDRYRLGSTASDTVRVPGILMTTPILQDW